jgi:hypothetical protein
VHFRFGIIPIEQLPYGIFGGKSSFGGLKNDFSLATQLLSQYSKLSRLYIGPLQNLPNKID